MYWYCGKLIESEKLELNINDPGLIYGATVFTTLRVYNYSLDHSLTNWQAHCSRLKFSLQTFGWPEPDWNFVRQGAEILLQHFPVLRITLFPDGREWITGRLLPENLTQKQNYGIISALTKSEFARSLPNHKTGNYLSPWLARNIVQSLNAEEAILVDSQGNWLETSTGNLWGWKEGCWWTPPLAVGILPGIERSHIINQLKNRQITVQQAPWTPELVKKLEAIAYTNSVVEIIPIHTVQRPTTGSLEYNPYHPCFLELKGLFLP
ncbi:aminotransferase class IV [Sphaerospermopsis aphanizomenoides BCCUSP55]|uniref:aminotransferase class IV n=1 Tax=Sphaerospermopsis aphanizomenoides TaxID=459663 RepID=UPI00190704C5|nr:aminotransferase class IV [Sphaerospermopsis aphanizomenoides]MBK1990058.1 aminotransferase class IV [Sphaerospermopsis aphanizomenoides BCCUSP55]